MEATSSVFATSSADNGGSSATSSEATAYEMFEVPAAISSDMFELDMFGEGHVLRGPCGGPAPEAAVADRPPPRAGRTVIMVMPRYGATTTP